MRNVNFGLARFRLVMVSVVSVILGLGIGFQASACEGKDCPYEKTGKCEHCAKDKAAHHKKGEKKTAKAHDCADGKCHEGKCKDGKCRHHHEGHDHESHHHEDHNQDSAPQGSSAEST